MDIDGQRVRLRPVVAADADRLAAILELPEVARWWPGYDRARVEAEFLTPDENVAVYAILAGDRLVGLIQTTEEPEPDFRHAAINLFLDPAVHGRGLGPDAIRAVARHLIEQGGHHRLTIDPAADNAQAIRAYEKVGFRPVGMLRRYQRFPDGSWRDGLLMELLAGDLREGTDPLLYSQLAPWFHLLTPPEDYRDDAATILDLLRTHVSGPLVTLLELGSGGGNTASHLGRDLRLTLTDLSPDMLELSRTINPGAEHLVGDMRTLRLGRPFDSVLIHDAICYLTSEADLRAAMVTAFEHLRPGGAAVLVPDHVRETFRPATDRGGGDAPEGTEGGPGRGLRYLEWTTDPDPADSTYEVDYAVMLRHHDGSVEVRHDHHVEGVFPRQRWLDLLVDVGFEPAWAEDPWARVVFVGRRPAGRGVTGALASGAADDDADPRSGAGVG